MIARLSTYDGPVDRLDEFVAGMEKNRGALAAMQGFEGAYMLVDRDSGTAVTLTLWRTKAEEAASAAEASRWRRDAADATAHRIVGVQAFEVAVNVRPG